MLEGQSRGGLLRRESRKHFVSWNGVLGVVKEDNGPGLRLPMSGRRLLVQDNKEPVDTETQE